MAEIVNRNTEEILPQFEEIIKVKLFSPSEMREIIQRHVEYEYKIVKREKQVSDFQQYVNYKVDLLKLVRIRMKLKNFDKKDRKKIENMLIKHIGKLYNMMIKYYPTDQFVWLDYIDFMTKEKNYAKVVLLYDSLLAVHMGNVELFLNAAKFMVKYIKDINLARKTLFKGIRIHKRSQLLYVEFFRIELEYSAKKRRQCEKDSERLNVDPVLCGKTAEVICTSGLKTIKDLKFKISLIQICSKYKFMKSLQKKIYRMLKSQHYFDAEMWKSIGKLQLEGINFESIDMNDLKSTEPLKQRIWRCFHVFSKAVKVIPTEIMWFHFVDTFFDLLKTNTDKFEYISKLILKIIRRSEKTNHLKKEQYLRWIENCENDYSVDKLMPIIDSLLLVYPQCAELWLKKLKYNLDHCDKSTFNEIFDLALSKMTDEKDRCVLWQFALQSYVDAPVSEMDAVFEKVMKESPTYPTLRLLYMDWILSRNDLPLVRNVFANLIRSPPYDIELFKKMITLETSQPEVDVKEIRRLFTVATVYFGSAYADIWLNYIQFEKSHGDAANVTNIYWQAVKQLEPSLSDKFITEYSMSKTV